MSVLTKVFIILVFFAALVKLGIDVDQYSHRVDFRDKYVKELNQHAQTIVTKNREIAEWKTQVENWKAQYGVERDKNIKLNEEIVGKTNAIYEFEKRINEQKEDRDKLQQEISKMVSLLIVTTTQIDEAQKRIAEFKQNLDKALAKSRDAEANLIEAKREADAYSKDLAATEENYAKCARELFECKMKLEAIARMGVPIPTGPGVVQSLKGKILSVEEELGLVAVSLGKKDGVEIGYKFTIKRGDKFVATGIVKNVENEMSILSIDIKGPGYPPSINDDVFTP